MTPTLFYKCEQKVIKQEELVLPKHILLIMLAKNLNNVCTKHNENHK